MNAMFDRALALHKTGQFAQAQDAYLEVLQVQADHFDALHMLGLIGIQTNAVAQAIEWIDKALQINPQVAQAHNHRGHALYVLKDFQAALDSFGKAINAKPDFADAYFRRGLVLYDLKQYQAAIENYDMALALKPDYVDAYCNRGIALGNLKRYKDAIASFDRAIAIRSDIAEVYSNRGIALIHLDQHEEGIKSLEHAMSIKPDFADAAWVLGQALLRQGRFTEGWEWYEARLSPAITLRQKYVPTPPLPNGGGQLPPRWQGQALKQKSVLIWPEQGMGDEIQFVRYLPLLKKRGAKHVTLVCKTALASLFEAQGLADRVISTADWLPEMALEFDYWSNLLSLPKHLGATLRNIPAHLPYLSAAPDRVAQWAVRLPQAALRVGLVWRGNPGHGNDATRSLASLSVLEPVWSVPGIAFVSLQIGANEDELGICAAHQALTHLGDAVADFADTAAIVRQLDLVISVDTAIVHLAGALGVPCWLLLPDYDTDWRWLENRTDSPWYPGVLRLFRQTSDGDWAGVLDRVLPALIDWRDGGKAKQQAWNKPTWLRTLLARFRVH